MLKVGLVALGLVCAAGASQAADPPSLKGTWKGSGQGVSRQDGWIDRPSTIEVTEQRGPAFDIGLTQKQVHEACQVRDAERAG
jgi:hypothetical protein